MAKKNHSFTFKSSIHVPEVGAFAIAGQSLSIWSEKFSRYVEFETGQVSLVVSMGGPSGPGKNVMTILVGEQTIEVNQYEQRKFLYAKPTDALNGKSLCITGDLHFIREAYTTFIKAHGGEYKTSVSKNVDYLITNDPHTLTTKLKKAKALGVTILSEQQFFDLLK